MFKLFLAVFFLWSFPSCRAQDSYYFKDLKLIFVSGDSTSKIEYFSLNETSKLLNHPSFDNNRPTMLYGYGYTEKYTSKSTQTIVDSYIERSGHNILVVEWSSYNDGSYIFKAIPNSRRVGDIFGRTLLDMRNEGFNVDKFHLVGHSLGGHLVGYIGRSAYKNSNQTYKVTRITALDPAGPFFDKPFFDSIGIWSRFTSPLNKADGKFVDVIHTDDTFFGVATRSGTADFWPNGGRDQPECPPANWDVFNENNFCSHRRSWAYFAESVRTIDFKTFNAVPCQSWSNFTDDTCENSKDGKRNYMGIDADPNQSGDFFCQTNINPPFNRGKLGTFYDSDEPSP